MREAKTKFEPVDHIGNLMRERDRASDACASVQRERDELREALREQIGECFDDRCEMCMRHEAILARYEGGR